MSDTYVTHGGETHCQCPSCDELFPLLVKTVEEGQQILCPLCQTEFEIRYMDISVTYGLRRLFD